MLKTGKLIYFVFSAILIGCYGQNSVPIERLNLVGGSPVNMLVGPEDAVYCRLLDPQGFTAFEGFGRCLLTIVRMDYRYLGYWNMYSGNTTNLELDFSILDVRLTEPERATVTAEVVYEASNAIINCSLPSGNYVQACIFRDPRGNEMLITGAQTTTSTDVGDSVSSELLGSECRITIYNIKDPGMGIWRCSLRMGTDVFYGYQTVFLRSALEDSSSIKLRPTIRPNRTLIMGVDDEPVVLSCSIDAPIRYCYFREYYSGKVVTASPDLQSSSAEYTGLGFEAGDCGVKLSGLETNRNLEWSCNIGVVGDAMEYSQTLDVYVQERLSVNEYRHSFDGRMTINAYFLYTGSRAELCRYVRADGFTFSTDQGVYPYQAFITESSCTFSLNEPTDLDLQPWVVTLKTVNNFELSKTTIGFVEEPRSSTSGFDIFLYVSLSIVAVSLIVLVVMGFTRFRRK